jgi:hypothetical protein
MTFNIQPIVVSYYFKGANFCESRNLGKFFSTVRISVFFSYFTYSICLVRDITEIIVHIGYQHDT